MTMDIVTATADQPTDDVTEPPAELSSDAPQMISIGLDHLGLTESSSAQQSPHFSSHIAPPSASSTPSGPAGDGALGRARYLPGRSPSPPAQNKPPRYPPDARRHGIERTVILEIEIHETGKVSSLTVGQSSGHAILDDAALDAVRKWTFEPSIAGAKL